MTDTGLAPPSSWGATLRRILQQGWPVLVGQWASMAFGVLDTAMTGHASPVALAAMALAVSIYVTVFIGLTGVLHALIPIAAQHFGGRRLAEIGRAWGQAVWLSLGLSVVGGLAMLFPDTWLAMSGNVDPAVRDQVRGYLAMLIVALPAALVFRTVYALNTAVSRPKVVMMINIAGIGFKALFNWLFIYGKFGLPALGAVGAGLSTALVFWISVGLSVLVLRRDPFYRQFGLRIGRPDRKTLGELLRLGLPMGGSYLIEVTSFTFMALLVAREGIYATGGHQIMANLVALCFMMPLALGVSTGALTAQAIGSGDPLRARRTGSAGLMVGTAGALLTIAVVILARGPIVQAYTSDAEVGVVALGLLGMLAFFHLFDSLQCMTSYLLRAYKMAVGPMLIQAGALWGIGLLGGWWLAFGPGAGALGGLVAVLMPGAPTGAGTMWLMATFSMAVSSLMLQYVYWRVAARRQAGPALAQSRT
ncbi:MATE family efflux transporter [Pigmentiphaga kullae]|uniref:MATE family multidrug resistance protein n=1 Tax=Pigmentiphaga kullae TaxID=151784 RepID=A0A4Q7N918_9BURK|nr:MATE family efflux transporter [Pigmentiphaga kullae]RZS78487.1 MATE family multidrug resistance protein [Pigmentiphaga kullae]